MRLLKLRTGIVIQNHYNGRKKAHGFTVSYPDDKHLKYPKSFHSLNHDH